MNSLNILQYLLNYLFLLIVFDTLQKLYSVTNENERVGRGVGREVRSVT